MRGLPFLALMSRRVMPAVVCITVLARSPTEDNPLYNNSLYQQFLASSRRRRVMAAGSGSSLPKLELVLIQQPCGPRRAEQIGVAL